MKARKTISLKVNNLPKEEYIILMEKCKDLFNGFTDWIYSNGTYNKNTLHKQCYQMFLEKYPEIKVALQQSVRDCASEVCKRNKIKGKTPIKKSLTIRLSKHCFTLRGNQLTLIGLNQRYKEILHVPVYYLETYQTWEPKGATLSFDKKKKQFWINIMFENPKEVKEISNTIKEKVLGVDRGIYNPIVTSDTNLSFMGVGKKIRTIKSNYQYLKRQLQKKGTRSAKRKLKTLSGKEKRFVLNSNHILSKMVANSNHDIFVLEKLKNFKKTKYRKNLNRKLSNWSYYQFEQLLKYKAEQKGKHIVYVNPAYTSQECSNCGKIEKTNRSKNLYVCSCGHKEHSDLNAAKIIKNRFLTSQDALKHLGVVVNQPNETPLKEVVSSSPLYGVSN